MKMINLTINDKQIQAPEGSTVLEAARSAGIYIPTLCYHPDLRPEGACRLCVVEASGARTLVASCVYPVSEGMVVKTNTNKVREARKTVVELLLTNHPKDCLSCQRNGNCELQKIAADLGRQNGGSATISMSGETTVPAEVIKAIADRQLKVEFAYDSTKSWLIDGAKITTVSAADFSLFPGSVDTSSLRGVSGGKYRISADIPAEIRFTFLKRYAGEFANVYKLVDGKLVFQTCIKLAEDGTAVVPGMSAPGEYAVMVCRYSDRQGDFDNNGNLDIYDAVALLRYSVGLESGENLQLIDLNGDGMVNCADASTVLRWLVGLSA